METLVIDLSSFPKGWGQQGTPVERAATVKWGVEKLGVNFISEHGVAQQDVHRGRDDYETEIEYLDRIKSTAWFSFRKDETEWYIPTDFEYQSTVAEHYRFACQIHIPSEIQSCQLY
jgi:hypothetical protein